MARLPLVSPLDRALFLKAQSYLGGIPPNVLAALAEYSEESFFARDQVIYEAGTVPERIHFLASGGVRTRYANDRSVDFIAPAGLGLVEYLGRSDDPPVTWAVEDTLALSLDADEFMQILEDDFALYMSVASGMGRATEEADRAWGAKRLAERGFSEDRLRETFATLDLVHRLAQAREAPFFQGSNLTVLTELLRFQQPRVLAAADLMYREGEPVGSMALVLDGTVATTNGRGETQHPAGSMTGGWEILSQLPRRETARALTPVRVIEIDRSHFTDVLEDHNEFALDYLGKLSRRLIELRSMRPDQDTGRDQA